MYHRSIVRSIIHYKINIVVKILILSDFFIYSASQLIAPIFAIFIIDNVTGAGLKEIGIATALFLIAKSICEIPIGLYIDKSKTEKDDLYTALIGTALMSLIYIAYIFIKEIWQLYLLQTLLGIAFAISYPGWVSIFSKHIDKGKEATEWSMYDVMLGVGTAATSALGGFIAVSFGFATLFVIVSVTSFIGSILLFLVRKNIK